ncbi:DUF3857 domain-containing protein, partial [Prolixibacteraceae bacterium]|nr:DUF3857 domain-containing protein [Prolixibacteraceae bacterium]
LFFFLGNSIAQAKKVKFGKVLKEELTSTFSSIDSTANAEYLYKSKHIYFSYIANRGIVVNEVVHERIKIYNKEGLNYANKLISYYSPEFSSKKKEVGAVKGYTYNLVDGKIVKERLKESSIFKERKNKYYNTKKIAFPNVREGSIVEYKYQIQSDFISISDIFFEEAIPIKKFFSIVQIPEYYIFNLKQQGYHGIKPVTGVENGQFQSLTSKNGLPFSFQQNTYEFQASNIEAFDNNEPYSGNVRPYVGKVVFELSGINFPGEVYENYSMSWLAVCDQISKNYDFTNELEKKEYYKKALANILLSAKDEQQKIMAIFDYVKTNVSWNQFYGIFTNKGVRHAFKNHEGNCSEINLMLTSMLRSAGLEANPVLISTKSHGAPLFPTIDGYNYVISVVHLEDNDILLDATDRYSAPNIIPTRCINWKGFEIRPNKTFKWINLVPNTYSTSNYNLFIQLDSNGKINGTLRRHFSNHAATNYLYRIENKSDETIIESLENKYNIDIKDYKKSDPIQYNKRQDKLSFSTDKFITRNSNELAVSPLCFLKYNSNPFKAEKRHFPVDFKVPNSKKSTVSIAIPKGYKVKYIPESKAFQLPDNLGTYSYRVQNTGFALSLVTELKINMHIFGPNYYPALKDFFEAITKQEVEKIVFTKG